MRHALRSSTVHSRAIVAAVLALGLVLTIAALAWAAPALSIDSGPTGPTNDDTPSFAFTTDGQTVECSIDQGTPDYGACSDTGAHTVPSPLDDGDWFFRVRATDDQQEQTELSQPFTVDTVADFSFTSGPSDPSDPTNETTPSFGFSTEAGATAECAVDEDAYASCTSPYVVATPLSDGPHELHLRVTDLLGNQAETSRSFTVDTVDPTVDVTSGPPEPTNDETPSFGFTVSDAGATSVECSIDRGSPVYESCSTAASHTASSLADGSYTFHVRATDAAGNSAEDSWDFSVDTVRPTVRVTSGPTITSDDTPSFEFTTDGDPTVVECSIDQDAYTPCASPYTPVASLPDGTYTFDVRVRDAAGNPGSDSQRFTVDSAVPDLTIDSGLPEATNDRTPSLGFAAEAGTTLECSVDRGSPSYAPCTSPHTPLVPLPDGTYTFRVRARDGAGNVAGAEQAFTIDTTPPSLSIGFGPSGTTADSTPLFGFTAEAGATLACSIDQGTPAYGPCASATTHAAGAPLADGAYAFRARATDRAGNQTTATRTFTVDTIPDTPAPDSPTPDPTPPTTTAATPPPAAPQLLSPFPLVRISGTLTRAGARIRLLTVRAAAGTLVRVTVSPGCRGARRCRALRASATVGRRGVVGFRDLARAYRSGTVIVVRVWRADRIGKYTRFTIVRGKAPRRVDQCLMPGATGGSRCPSV